MLPLQNKSFSVENSETSMSFDTTTATKTTRNHLHGDIETSAAMRATTTKPTRATTTTTTRSHLRGELGDINVL